MKSLFLVLFFTFFAVRAEAQTWHAAPNTQPLTAADVAQLPFSVTFDFVPSISGWVGTSGGTWDPVWPRNAPGAWYRRVVYTQPNAINRKWIPSSYFCRTAGLGFTCDDHVRGIMKRPVQCPRLYIGPLKMWRSIYNAAWQEQGLFTANIGPFSATTGREMTLQSVSVTNNGQYLNCMYGNTTVTEPVSRLTFGSSDADFSLTSGSA